jgi:hypothetical protein
MRDFLNKQTISQHFLQSRSQNVCRISRLGEARDLSWPDPGAIPKGFQTVWLMAGKSIDSPSLFPAAFFQSVAFRSVLITANIDGFDTLRRCDDHLYYSPVRERQPTALWGEASYSPVG